MLGLALIFVLTSTLLGCSPVRKDPLTMDEFKDIYNTIEGELIELGEDTHTDKASAMILGRMHDVNIIYYQMETEEDANELFTNISAEIDKVNEEVSSGTTSSSKGSSIYWLHNGDGCYYLVKDGSNILYGTGFDDDWQELRYLMYKLSYYEYDETYIKNQKEVAEQTYGY